MQKTALDLDLSCEDSSNSAYSCPPFPVSPQPAPSLTGEQRLLLQGQPCALLYSTRHPAACVLVHVRLLQQTMGWFLEDGHYVWFTSYAQGLPSCPAQNRTQHS